MTTSVPDAAWLPSTRPAGCPYNPPESLAAQRAEEPLSRIQYAGGHTGWMVTSHALARAVFADPRFSVRSEYLRNPIEGGIVVENPPPAPRGFLTNTDPPEHSRYRRQLMGQFTVQRMKKLTGRVEEIVATALDELERQGPPADLVNMFARYVPSLMIGELLGVSPADRDRFYELVEKFAQLRRDNAPLEEQAEAFMAGRGFVAEVVLTKRADPTDDLFSDLVTDTDFTDEEVVNVAIMLLGAGVDSVASTISLGTMALLNNPEQLDALRRDPALAERAVEELLRYTTAFPISIRAALEDVELDGRLIRKGENVTVYSAAANRDPAKFADPDELNLARTDRGHVAFGHGVHQCLAQQLARVELKVAFPALVTRFPHLRLELPADEVPVRNEVAFYGLHSLPVSW